jgi:hypothetical protein
MNFIGSGVSVADLSGNTTVTILGLQDSVVSLGNISGNLSPNRTLASIQTATLTGNINLNQPLNMSVGQSLTLIFTQDAVGNRIMTPNANYKFAGNFKTLSFSGNSIDMLNMFYDGTRYYVTLTTGYA